LDLAAAELDPAPAPEEPEEGEAEVVFPEPLSPTTPSVCPSRTARLIPSTALM